MSLRGFSFLRGVGLFNDKTGDGSSSGVRNVLSPSLTIQLDKEIYRPGDSVIATIEISSLRISRKDYDLENSSGEISSLLVDNLSFEIRGIEKVDTQWFSTQKPLPGSKQRRGEHHFLDFSAPSIVSKVVVSSSCSKTYIVRANLPKVLPPSYRGISIRYIYYVRTTMVGRWLLVDDSNHSRRSIHDFVQVEARAPLQIWVSQKSNNLLSEEGTLLVSSDQLDIYWKEKDADSEWVRANENLDMMEEGYESSRDEVSSIFSYNPSKGNADVALRNSLSLQSIASRLSNNEVHYSQGERSSFPIFMPLTQLSVAEVIDDSDRGPVSQQDKLNHSPTYSPNQQRSFLDLGLPKDDLIISSYAPKSIEPAGSEGFIRGRSYNIRIDDQVLLRFSPKNSDSTYFFGDMIGGTLTFFHGGVSRCLEVSISLEISETITQRFVHPSRRSSPTITKVQSEHYEVVADLVQTSFLFSIPIDGPMSFSTPKVSVQWSLRFEFFTTPKDLDLTRFEHLLLVEQREKGEWVLPIMVYAPPLRSQSVQTRNEKPLTLGNLFRT